MITTVEVERFSLTSSRPFDKILAAIKAAVGHPDMVEFAKTTAAAWTFSQFESTVRKGWVRWPDALHGTRPWLRHKESDGWRQTPNGPAHHGQSAHHAANGKASSGRRSYAPVTVLVDERSDGVHISYDRMVSLLAPYRNSDALAVARDLDKKVETFLSEAAG